MCFNGSEVRRDGDEVVSTAGFEEVVLSSAYHDFSWVNAVEQAAKTRCTHIGTDTPSFRCIREVVQWWRCCVVVRSMRCAWGL